MDFPTLHTPRLTLRMPGVHEVQLVVDYRLRNRDFLYATNPDLPKNFYTVRFWTLQLQKNRDEFAHGRSCRFFLFDSNRIVGGVGLYSIVRGALQAAQLGYSIDEHYQGLGHMTEALTAVIEYAFGSLDLHRVTADHLPSNHRSAALLARLDFQIEGYSKRYLRMADGEWHDHVRTARVRRDE